jgi:hypothetical protein
MAADRILSTHVGSLIRPPELVVYLKPLLDGQPYDEAAFGIATNRYPSQHSCRPLSSELSYRRADPESIWRR